MWQLDADRARRAAAYRDGDRAVPPAARRRDRPGRRCARAVTGARPARRRSRSRIERSDGSVVDCATVPLPDGAHAGHVPGRHRLGQCRARAARAQRGAGGGRRAQDRLRPPRVLRAALAAHQHHRLHAFPRRSRRPARSTSRQREYLGYITVSTNALLAIIDNILDLATIDAGAMTLNLGPVDIRTDHGSRRRGRAGPAGQGRHHARPARRRRHRQLRRRRAARAPGAVQPPVQRDRLLAAGGTVRLPADRAPRRRRVLGRPTRARASRPR